MNIAGTLQNGTFDNGVYQSDGRRVVYVVVKDVSCKLCLLQILIFRWSLSLHGLNGSCGTLVSIKYQNGMLHTLCGGDHRHNFLTDRLFNFLDCIEVHGVAHGKVKLVLLNAHRHYLELFRNVFRNSLCHGNRNRSFRKIYVFNTQLETKGLNQLRLCDDSRRNKGRTKSFLGLLLSLQSHVQFFRGNGTRRDQQVSKTFVCHLGVSPLCLESVYDT